MRFPRLLWRLLRGLLLTLAFLWFLFEEFGWHPLAAWMGGFAHWGPWARMEERIAALPPRAALCLFLVPVLFLLPVKLLALAMMHGGHPWLGFVVILAAKLFGTAVSGRIFLLTRPQLMRIRRFARWMAWWRVTRSTIRRAMARTGVWARLQVWRARVRAFFR